MWVQGENILPQDSKSTLCFCFLRFLELFDHSPTYYEVKEKTRKLGELTKLFLVNKKKKSLRTTIAMTLVDQWKLTEDDYLEWTWDVVNGEMVMRVKKGA